MLGSKLPLILVRRCVISFQDVQIVFDMRTFPVIHQGVLRFRRPSWNSPNIDEWMNEWMILGDGHQPNSKGLCLYTHYKDSPFFKVRWVYPQYRELIDPGAYGGKLIGVKNSKGKLLTLFVYRLIGFQFRIIHHDETWQNRVYINAI